MKKKFLAMLLCLSFACAPVTAYAEEESESATGSEEITVIDSDDCIVKITSMEADSEYGYILGAYLENNSDTDYYFSISDASINGVVCDPYYGEEVAAGKKSNTEVVFYSYADITEDIGDISCIELTFDIYDWDTWDEVTDGTVCIYPEGEENAVLFERETLESDTILLDNEYATILVTGYGYDEWGYTLNLYVVNKTETKLYYYSESASVNGYMADPYWGAEIPAGKSLYTSMTWYEEDLEANSIEDISDIEFTLLILDDETWDEYVNETITFEPVK